MPSYRKMLSDTNAPYLQLLMRLIESQSKATICQWCIAYTEAHILPIYANEYPYDERLQNTLNAAKDWLAGKVKLPFVKDLIINQAHAAARQAEGKPAAQAAARATGQAAACIHTPTHSLGLPLYGALAIAYHKVGINGKWQLYESIAAEECAKMESALRDIAIENEPNPAKVKWKC